MEIVSFLEYRFPEILAGDFQKEEYAQNW